MPTVNQLKARDRWERNVKIAFEHEKLVRNNFKMYQKNATQTLERYERWLEKYPEIQPSINLELFKSN